MMELKAKTDPKLEMINLVRNVVSYLPVIGLLLIIISTPFGYNIVQKTGHFMFGIGYVLDYSLNKRWVNWRWASDKWIYVAMLSIYILIPLWQLWDQTPVTEYFMHILDRFSMFLFIGIMGLLGFSDKLRLCVIGFAMLMTTMVVIGVNIYLYIIEYGVHAFDINWFNHVRAIQINSHMVINLYINTALILGVYLLKTKINLLVRILTIISMLCATGYVLLSVGRVGFMTMLLLICIVTLVTIWKYTKIRWITMVVLGCLCVCFMLQHERMKADKVLEDPRFALWDYSIRMSKNHPFLGYGISSLSVEYVDGLYVDPVAYEHFTKRIMSQPTFAALGKTMKTHHPHNAFLMMYLSFGILGVLSLIFLYVTSLLMPSKEMRIYVWFFLLALFIQMQFEPIGAHLQPQFIAIMLLCFQRRSIGVNNKECLSL